MITALQAIHPRTLSLQLLAGTLAVAVVAPGLALGQDARADVIDRSAPVVVETSITIDAPPAEVWGVLTDVARWPEWNEYIRSATLEGPLETGSTIMWTVGAMNIRSRLTAVDPERGLDWDGLDGDTRGLHSWRLVPEGEGTRVTNVESLSGGSADAEPEAITEQLTLFLDAWNEQIKAEVEG